MAARARARRIELIPAAPPLPRILFTGDAPPPGFEAPIVPTAPALESASFGESSPSPARTAGLVPPGGGPATAVTGGATRLNDAPREVWLTARDPFTVVAHWDRELPEPAVPEQEWGRGRWWMRLHEGSADGPVVTERPATESAGTVLLPVLESGQKYVAELGYDSHRSGWHGVAISHPVPTPSDRPSVAPEVPKQVQWGTVAPWEGEPGEGSAIGYVPVPPPVPGLAAGGSAAPVVTRVEEVWEEIPGETEGHDANAWRWSWALWTGVGQESSGEFASSAPDESESAARKGRRVRKESIAGEGSVAEGAEDALVSSEELTAMPVAGGRRGFWFRVNAEVILHGSTEPDARVTVAGRPVALRPDGSFSFRFAFPDGDFRLPLEAVSADSVEGRKAVVRFLRATNIEGDVGVHPVAPAWDAALEEWGT